MSEAVRTLEKELFRIGFHRIEIKCNAANRRSARIPKSCGYKHEGTLRDDSIENGQFRNSMIFAKIAKQPPKRSR